MDLRSRIDMAWHELRGSRRLQLALLALAVIAATEGGLRWSERLSAHERQLQELRSELRGLRAQSRDEAALRQALAKSVEARRELDARLWRVPSEAIGQARLKDWLGDIAKQADVSDPTVTLSAARSLSSADKAAGVALRAVQELRAVLRFGFTPAGLERTLAAIEGGSALAVVEALSASRRDQRVEITVRVLVRVEPPPAPMVGT